MGAGQQLGVGAPQAFLAGGEPGEHALHPLRLLRTGESVRDEYHDSLTVAIRGHRPSPALTAPHFHDRLARAGHYRLARPGFGFTLRR
ncbi:hypothetical protein Aca07nite_09200 [Actinoplanes capillaceus]|uniref:Uncharacterized protein n=1 Tax=Actinoplanes campanulatus TaxID=113559 RepID=A0ABQ3WCS4_9ACTN|nr:hypothetical protein Aca07nite_09200 [Actinoplanes capillaceus]